jgi:hypothetical protein
MVAVDQTGRQNTIPELSLHASVVTFGREVDAELDVFLEQ